MTAKQYLIRACQHMNVDLMKPTKSEKGILIYDWSTGKGKCVADALTWNEAKEQFEKWRLSRV